MQFMESNLLLIMEEKQGVDIGASQFSLSGGMHHTSTKIAR